MSSTHLPRRPSLSGNSARTPVLGFAALLLVAVLVRVIAALRKSLVLDEFHTWFHATQPSLELFLATLRLDNHPPLGMATVALSKWLAGSSELALRAPALVFGALELALIGWLGARVLGRRVALAGVGLLAFSTLHIDVSSQVRMYALHSLGATAALVAVHSLLTRETPSRSAAVALCAALVTMFHTHYFGGHYVLGLGLAAGLLGALDEELRARLRRLVAPALVASVLCLPWALWGLRFQLGHALPPGGRDRSLADLAEAFVHLFFINVRLGGSVLRPAFIAAGALAFVLGLLGVVALWRDPRRRPLGVLLAASVFLVPALAWVISNLAPRSGFTWHYVLPSAAPLALLAAAGALEGSWRGAGLRRVTLAGVLFLAALLTGLNLATRGTEDFRGAVAHILARHRPGDAVISVEWQPALFAQGQPYDYYAPRLAADPPARLACRGFTLAEPAQLEGRERVHLLARSLPEHQHLMRLLHEDFDLVERRSFGFGLEVLLWERHRSP